MPSDPRNDIPLPPPYPLVEEDGDIPGDPLVLAKRQLREAIIARQDSFVDHETAVLLDAMIAEYQVFIQKRDMRYAAGLGLLTMAELRYVWT